MPNDIKIFGARCGNTGLGIQTWEFFNHIPCDAFVIDTSRFMTMPQYHERFPNQTFYQCERGLQVPREIIEKFVEGTKVVWTFETPYDYSLYDICREKGIKTILYLNYEFLEYPSDLPKPDLFVSPSTWYFNNIPHPNTYLPFPVREFEIKKKEKTFVHIAGHQTTKDRNGTMDFLNCLKYVKSDINVILRTQRRIEIPEIPSNVNITLWSERKNYADNYEGGVLVMPRKYGGLCLPLNEALSSGMPVIINNCSPNEWLPKEWRVECNLAGTVNAKKRVDYYEVNQVKLAEKIDDFCDKDFYLEQVDKAVMLREKLLWKNLCDKYLAL